MKKIILTTISVLFMLMSFSTELPKKKTQECSVENSAILKGKLIKDDNTKVSNAEILLIDADNNEISTTESNMYGDFEISCMKSKYYKLNVKYEGKDTVLRVSTFPNEISVKTIYLK